MVEGTWALPKRHGWSWQQPTRRAIEHDEQAAQLWKKEVWPRENAPWRLGEPGWSSRRKPGRPWVQPRFS
ncbi:winged helix-turn-helix domain-containing protein [Streptomyces sp. TLI_105]|uniref:winged helix-turn-helix domain-containing protein n=1 Tax=Streptomyces sp. TLI_105 TaxID=1881019 RepID=UPI00210AAE7F|nr:winged helix-turn-helix domain-containing protein [Streptomyces sp. TLI_105]